MQRITNSSNYGRPSWITHKLYWTEKIASKLKHQFHMKNLKRAQGKTDSMDRPIKLLQTFPIVEGDTVQVVYRSNEGKHRWHYRGGSGVEQPNYTGMKGEVKAVLREKDRIIVSGINVQTRVMPRQEEKKGYYFKTEASIPYSSVRLLHPITGLALEDGALQWKKNRRAEGEGFRLNRWVVNPQNGDKIFLPPPKETEPVPPKPIHPSCDTLPQYAREVTYLAPTSYHTRGPSIVTSRLPVKKDKEGHVVKDAEGRAVVDVEEMEKMDPQDKELTMARFKF